MGRMNPFSKKYVRRKPQSNNNAVRFNPGMFILPLYNQTTQQPSNWNTIKTELVDFDGFGGVQLRWNWNQIEVAEGDYSGIDTLIKPYLAEIGLLSSGLRRKRLHILFHIRHSHPVDRVLANDMVPDYMIGNPAYGGGQWLFDSANPDVPGAGGKLICWWNANVQAKAALLAQALGDELNAYVTLDAASQLFNPLEGIAISETATGTAVALANQPSGVSFPSNFEEKYWEGYYKFAINLRDAFPNTVVGAFCNHEKSAVKTIITGGAFYNGAAAVNGILTEGIALGGPNTLPDDPGLRADSFDGATPPNPGVYAYYPLGRNNIVLMPSWQKPDYRRTRLSATALPGHEPTIEELYLYSKDVLFANYIFATRTDEASYWVNLKNYLTSTGLKNSVTCGLNTTPPSCYESVLMAA